MDYEEKIWMDYNNEDLVSEKILDAKRVLKDYFGHESFLTGQESVIRSVLNCRDALAIMPTGGGKSVCYQIPAMLFDGTCIVISPLISLMKDQIHNLTASGIPAAYINSTLTDSQIDRVIENAKGGAYKLLFIAPERLLSSRFLDFCHDAIIPFVAVDEAHCVSQWGQDFRPSYSTITQFISSLKKRPVVAAFTATATKRVREDIVRLLGLIDPSITLNSFDRKNLYFEVRHPGNRYEELKYILGQKSDLYGIVYCSTRKTVEQLYLKLKGDGFNVAKYHAGLSDKERNTAQDDFIYDRVNIIIATNAFGMGIDKSNVSFVIHYNMPKDIESYYQEAGRAGRDGNRAECILLFNGQDIRTILYLIENSTDKVYESEEQKILLKSEERKRLKVMEGYAGTTSCNRNYILKYFGESPFSDCGNCGNCDSSLEETNITIPSQKILSCIVRTNESYGRNTIIEILKGSLSRKIINQGLSSLPTYGICLETEEELKGIIGYLVENEYLTYTSGQYPLLKLGKNASRILKDREPLSMKLAVRKKEKRFKSKYTTKNNVDADANLVDRLKALRRKLADDQGVPAYIVFGDSSLIDMAAKLPVSLNEFLDVSGVGNRKLETYGQIFLNEIIDYMKENGIEKSRQNGIDSVENRIGNSEGNGIGNSEGNGIGNSMDMQADSDIEEFKTLKKNKASRHYYLGSFEEIDFSFVEISDKPMRVGEFFEPINGVLEKIGVKKLTTQTVNEWLTEMGFLYAKRDDTGKLRRFLKDLGREYGIIEEVRMTSKNVPYIALLYTKEAQMMLKENLPKILQFRLSQTK